MLELSGGLGGSVGRGSGPPNIFVDPPTFDRTFNRGVGLT